MNRLKVLAVAVITGRIGYVLTDRTELLHWGSSTRSAASPARAAEQLQKWIATFKPDMVVSEDPYRTKHKGGKARRIMEALAEVAERSGLANAAITRRQAFKNKYEEARDLVAKFPLLVPWLPKQPRIWEAEPHSTLYFEALALAMQALPAK